MKQGAIPGSREPSLKSRPVGFDPGREEIGHASRVMWEQSAQSQLVEDVSQIVRVAPFIVRLPARLFNAGLASELAEAVDILACKVADLREAEGASR